MTIVLSILRSKEWKNLTIWERSYVLNEVLRLWLLSDRKSFDEFSAFITASKDKSNFIFNDPFDLSNQSDTEDILHVAQLSRYKSDMLSNEPVSENKIVDALIRMFKMSADENPHFPTMNWDSNEISVAIRGPLESYNDFQRRLKRIYIELGHFTFVRYFQQKLEIKS